MAPFPFTQHLAHDLALQVLLRAAQFARDDRKAAGLRVRREIELTMTFKQKKIDLVAQGFDPGATADAIYFDDPRQRAYVRLDPARYRDIVDGKVKL